MQFEFITINNFSLIPVTRFIIDDVSSKYDTKVTEIFIRNQYIYKNVKKTNYIGKFKNYYTFSRQSIIFKTWKHFYIYFKLLSVIIFQDKNIYTPDIEVLGVAIKLKKLFKCKSRLIYHQFELLEIDFLPKNKQPIWKYILENTAQLGLIIFPEINRLNFFIETTKFPIQKTLLFANTCSILAKKDEIASQELKNTLELISKDNIIVGHIGSLGEDHYYKEFIDIIESSTQYKLHFIIIGNYDSTVSQAFQLIKNPSITIIKLLPHKDLLAVYQYINVGLILYKGVNKNFEYCAPNKLYEYWSNGIQVVANNLQGLKPLFNDESMGKLFDLNNQSNIIEIVNHIRNTQFSPNVIKEKFQRNYSIKKQLESLQIKLEK